MKFWSVLLFLLFIHSTSFAQPSLSPINWYELEGKIGDNTQYHASYHWNSKEVQLNTNDAEILILFKDGTFFYSRECPNIDNSTTHVSGGYWEEKDNFIEVYSPSDMEDTRYVNWIFFIENKSWKKKGNKLVPVGKPIKNTCGENTLLLEKMGCKKGK